MKFKKLYFLYSHPLQRSSAPVAVSGKTPAERLQNAWIKLQTDVNCYMDSDLDKLSLDKVPGIRQVVSPLQYKRGTSICVMTT